MRKLVSIVEVGKIRPIDGADMIEIATIVGKAWQCVIKKGELNEGDTAVYFEIDSFLPVRDEFEFLRKTSLKKMHGEEGFRLKTIRLRGELSQGLLIPTVAFSKELAGTSIGDDVTELLGVVLYEAPIPAQLAGEVKGGFPGFLSKSDQERIQNCMHYFERYKDVTFEVTVKMDGSSFSSYYNNELENKFGVCSRNLELKENDKNTFWKVARNINLEQRLSEYYSRHGRNLMIQAELCGDGIQKNRDKIHGHNVFVFDIFDIDQHKYVPYAERMDIINELNSMVGDSEILHVPVVGHIKVFQDYQTFDELQKLAEGESFCKDNRREGVVCKSEPVDGNVVTFKVISNRYLLKHGE